jgi:hypothetical protein
MTRTVDLLKAKFDEYVRLGSKLFEMTFTYKGRVFNENEVLFMRAQIWDELENTERLMTINEAVEIFLKQYYYNYAYFLFLGNKYSKFLKDVIIRFPMLIHARNTNFFGYNGQLYKIFFMFKLDFLYMYINSRNFFFLLFHFYYIALSFFNCINYFLFNREILKVFFYYRLSFFFVILKNLLSTTVLFDEIKKLKNTKDKIIYYLKLFYLYYLRHSYYLFYFFSGRLIFFILMYGICILFLFDFNMIHFCIYWILKSFLGIIKIFNVFIMGENITNILIFYLIEFKEHLSYIFSQDVFFENFYFQADKYILGKKKLIPLLFKKILMRLNDPYSNSEWLRNNHNIAMLLYYKRFFFGNPKLRPYLFSYVSYIIIPMEYHLYFKSFFFWIFLYIFYTIEWFNVYCIDVILLFFRKNNFLFGIYYYFYILKSIVKFLSLLFIYKFYIIFSSLILYLSLYIYELILNFIYKFDELNYVYYYYLVMIDLWQFILFSASFTYILFEIVFYDIFFYGINIGYNYLHIDIGYFMQQYLTSIMDWWNDINFTHFYLGRFFKKKIRPFFIVYKKKWTGENPWLKMGDYGSFNLIIYFLSKNSLDSLNNMFFLNNISFRAFVVLYWFTINTFIVFSLVIILNYAMKNIFKNKNILMPNAFYLWKKVNEKNLHRLSDVEHRWSSDYQWTDVFYRIEEIKELDNPYRNMDLPTIRKTLYDKIAALMKKDNYNLSHHMKSEFNSLYTYINLYIQNRFFVVSEQINEIFKKGILGSKSKFQYLQDAEFSLKYPRHYRFRSRGILKHFASFTDDSKYNGLINKLNNIWTTFGLDYLLFKNNTIFSRLPKEYFIYLNKCYLIYMCKEESRVDLVDYAFLNKEFYESLITMIGYETKEYDIMPLKDAILARVKNMMYFQADNKIYNIELLKKFDFFFEWLNGIDKYFNNFFFFYIYDFKKDNTIVRTKMKFEQIKTIFLERFYDTWEYYTFDEYDRHEGNEYGFQKEVFTRMAASYNVDKNNQATLQFKEEHIYAYTLYVIFFISYFTAYFLFFYTNIKTYIKVHLAYELLIAMSIFLKCFNIRWFFYIMSTRFIFIPKATIMRTGWKRPDQISYMYTITNGSDLTVSQYNFFWIMSYIFHWKWATQHLAIIYFFYTNFFDLCFFGIYCLSIIYILYIIYLINGLPSKK